MSVRAYLDSVTEGSDDRRHTRHQLSLATSGARPGDAASAVLIHNASTSGMLIETDLVLTQGEALLVNLPEAPLIPARIVWVNDRFYGCEFESPISSAVLSAAQLRSDAALPNHFEVASPSFKPAAEGLGKRIEQLRKSRSLTLADVASELGVSKPTVWAWEKGKARPVEDRLPAIAQALGVDVTELTTHSTQKEGEEIIKTSRNEIARAYGISPEKVRIMIEL
ncbi:helix-turn-helix domain-containing protein [Erythrobacteraceae bacterium E2-1 Yellow Sea]|nr:helix-turn-helix domain-containing protein [Erythrobacteraceae bacterium E2-1 Yellow Sea]